MVCSAGEAESVGVNTGQRVSQDLRGLRALGSPDVAVSLPRSDLPDPTQFAI